MNLASPERLAEDSGIPNGYGSWAEVPDSRIPIRLVSGSGLAKTRPSPAQRSYLKGPIPLDWLVAITGCGHSKALQVALAFKLQTDRRREAWVKPPSQILNDLGISKMDLSRCTRALEQAGLLEVQRRTGRPLLVRLVPWKGFENG
jgi:hypothetical protein